MDTNGIKTEYERLSKELRSALSRMERTDRVVIIRKAIQDLQHLCTHNNGSFDFTTTSECPYCGKKFGK